MERGTLTSFGLPSDCGAGPYKDTTKEGAEKFRMGFQRFWFITITITISGLIHIIALGLFLFIYLFIYLVAAEIGPSPHHLARDGRVY